MTGLSVVRMISHVGVRLMVRHGSGGQPTARLQDKSRTVRPGRTAKERWPISAQPQCALSHGNVRFQEIRATSTVPAHCAKGSPDPSYNRAGPRVFRPFCQSRRRGTLPKWSFPCHAGSDASVR
jgi:hypothetical protein